MEYTQLESRIEALEDMNNQLWELIRSPALLDAIKDAEDRRDIEASEQCRRWQEEKDKERAAKEERNKKYKEQWATLSSEEKLEVRRRGAIAAGYGPHGKHGQIP